MPESDPQVTNPSLASHGRSLMLLLAACSAIASMATNLILPALPQIRDDFNTNIAAVQTMLSVYMIAFAGGILAVGPLSDRLGRRPVVIWGLVIFACGSLISIAATSLPMLVFGRVIQALGASTGFVVARAVIGDLMAGVDLTRGIATLSTVAVTATTISPFLGALTLPWMGWRGPFLALIVIPLALAILCWRRLPETRSTHHLSLPASDIGKAVWTLISQGSFLACVIQAGAVYSIFMVFVTTTPYIVMGQMEGSPTEFGLYYAFIAAGYFFGSLYVSRHKGVSDPRRTLIFGMWLQLGSAALALMLIWAGFDHPAWLFGPMLPLAVGQGLAMPYISARALSLAPGYAGVAASLLAFSQQALAAISVQAMGWAHVETAAPMLIYCTLMALLAVATLRQRSRKLQLG